MAVLWGLRQQLVEDFDARTAWELMLIDLAVVAYHHSLRVQGWIGDASLHIEHEFFTLDSPTARLRERHGTTAVGKLNVEDTVQRLTQQLMPLLDRSNRMLLRNLRAIRDLRRTPAPSVAIGRADQINVGAQQVNTVEQREDAPPRTEVRDE